jgi:hypothetical protein
VASARSTEAVDDQLRASLVSATNVSAMSAESASVRTSAERRPRVSHRCRHEAGLVQFDRPHLERRATVENRLCRRTGGVVGVFSVRFASRIVDESNDQ